MPRIWREKGPGSGTTPPIGKLCGCPSHLVLQPCSGQRPHHGPSACTAMKTKNYLEVCKMCWVSTVIVKGWGCSISWEPVLVTLLQLSPGASAWNLPTGTPTAWPFPTHVRHSVSSPLTPGHHLPKSLTWKPPELRPRRKVGLSQCPVYLWWNPEKKSGSLTLLLDPFQIYHDSPAYFTFCFSNPDWTRKRCSHLEVTVPWDLALWPHLTQATQVGIPCCRPSNILSHSPPTGQGGLLHHRIMHLQHPEPKVPLWLEAGQVCF